MTCGGVAHAGERGLGDREAVVAVEVGGLLEHDLVLVPRLVEHVVQALVAVDRRARAGLALQVDDRRPVREHLHDQVALRLAALDVVGADMGEDAGDRGHAAVDGDDRHLGVDRLLQRRRHRVDLVRADHDALDALGERRLDVGGLLRRRVLAVALERLIALLGRLGLEAPPSCGRRTESSCPGTESKNESACRRRRRARKAPSRAGLRLRRGG